MRTPPANALLASAVAALVAALVAAPPAAAAHTVTVNMPTGASGNGFDQKTYSAHASSPIRFVHSDQTPNIRHHPVSNAPCFDAGEMRLGDVKIVSIAGATCGPAVSFRCSIHPIAMQAVILVDG